MGELSESIFASPALAPTSDVLLVGKRCTGWERRADEFKIPIWGSLTPENQTTVLRGEWAELHQILGVRRPIIDAHQVCLDFRYVASFRYYSAPKSKFR